MLRSVATANPFTAQRQRMRHVAAGCSVRTGTRMIYLSKGLRKVQRAPCRVPIQPMKGIVCQGVKIIDNYDGSFVLDDTAKEVLTAMLSSGTFCKQVLQECKLDWEGAEYTGMLFQPVPWSLNTPKGMAKEFEQYLASPDYAIVNIPPNYMFKAKVFKPSRLCAIFKRVGTEPSEPLEQQSRSFSTFSTTTVSKSQP